jgi:predicted ATPase/DNA-binding SARP family transcriptional activator
MPALTLALLGAPQVTRADGGAVVFRSRKHLALLAYLAVEQRHSHSRDTLLGLLWPEADEDAARTNLRVALADLRRLLGEGDTPFLLASRHSVQFAPTSDHALDVAAFSALLAECRAHAHNAPASCDACTARLAQAVELYRSDFLAGFALPDSATFEEWALIRREQLHQQALEALETLAATYERQGDYAAQCHYARRQLVLEPWREQAHRQLMRGLALSGDRSAALTQYETCRRVLAADLGIEPDEETHTLYEQIRAGETRRQADEETRSRVITNNISLSERHNLPAALTPLVGREAELTQLAAWLTRPGCRLITLVGPGGIGKTRLALELALRHVASFAGGVFLVRLASIHDPEVVASTIAQTLGFKESGGQSPQELLTAWLCDKRLLLILDNFEHLLEAAPLVTQMLAAAPGLSVIVTSRAALHLYGEHLFQVPALALPNLQQLPQPATFAEYPAIRLFTTRVQAVRADFALTAENAPVVVEICARLDGLPLAIELAAARGQRLAPARILEYLTTRPGGLQILAGGARDLPPRQQTMRATIAWSYDLLSPVEQTLFRRLAVFAGGWTVEGAEAITDFGFSLFDFGFEYSAIQNRKSKIENVLEGLDSLVDKSLIVQTEELDGALRFTMLETIREYALERLEESGELEVVRQLHAACYLALAEAEATTLGGAEQAAGLARLEREHDNLRAALAWARERGELELGLRLAGTLWPFWQRHCHLSEGRRWLEGLLVDARASAVVPEVRATALSGAAWLAHDQDDLARADALFEESLSLERALGQTGRVAAVLAHRGIIARHQGQYAQAAALIEESLALARAAEDQAGIAYALFRLGVVTRERGDFARATTIYQECFAAYMALGDRSRAAFAVLGLGDIARDQGDAAQLEAYCAESLTISRELGHHWSVGFSLNNLALAAAMRGDLARAAALVEEGVALFRAHGIRGAVVELLVTQRQIACAQADYERARVALAEGVALGWPAGPHWLVVTGLEELARVAVAQSQAAHAAQLYGAVAAWRAKMGAPLPPYRRATYEAALAAARRTLGEDDFAAAWAEGDTWRPEQAIAAALAAPSAE